MSPAEFKIACRVVIAQAKFRPVRLLLTAMSIAAAACVVIWVVSGYDSLGDAFAEFSDEYFGRYSLFIVPKESSSPQPNATAPTAISEELIAELSHDPGVFAVDPVYQTRILIETASETPTENAEKRPPLKAEERPLLLGTNAEVPPYPLLAGRWIELQQRSGFEGVLSASAAQKLNIRLGDRVKVSRERGAESMLLTIVGLVDQPKILPAMDLNTKMPSMRVTVLKRGPAETGLYVSMAKAAELSRAQAQASFAGVVLKDARSERAFREKWSSRLAAATPPAEIQSHAEVDSELQNSSTSAGLRAQAYTATGISLLAAMFIIFTTLSMGVDERIRQLAMLRAVSFTKSQVGVMILIESMLLGLIGWCGGLLAGWGLLTVASRIRPDFFATGVKLGTWCVVLSGICAFGGSLIASILPAWRATSTPPLEGMIPRTSARPKKLINVMSAIGLVLISLGPLLLFFLPMPDAWRYPLFVFVGCPSLAIGFVMIAPLAVRVTEKLFAPLLARAMRLNGRLIATQLSSNIWRTVGITVALTLGLGLFVAMQVWGYTLLAPFLPGRWMPDYLVSIGPAGISDAELQSIRRTPGIAPGKCLAFASEQTKFATDITGSQHRSSATRQDNCIMAGVDLDLALGGDQPMFPLRFVQGSLAEAIPKLKQGRYCLVPDHFQRETGLGVGDRFAVIPPQAPDSTIEYEIAGVVSLEGWHLMSKSGLRNRNVRTAALMIADIDTVRRDFAIDRIRFFWMNLDGSVPESDVQAQLQVMVQRDQENTRAATNDPAAKSGRSSQSRRSTVRVNMQSSEKLRNMISMRADQIIWGMSKLPLVTLAVTSIGVINTVLSSIRARRWEFGVLRAIGFTRFSLFRLIVAEALLVGTVVCVLSLLFGMTAGYCGTELTRYTEFHSGPLAPLVIPWQQLSLGFAATFALCFIAALLPAIVAGRTEPLTLLQAGRSST